LKYRDCLKKKLRTNIKLTPTQDNYLNTSSYISLAELRRKKESNSEAYASKSDALLPSYPQVTFMI